jgi:hypothetical protein
MNRYLVELKNGKKHIVEADLYRADGDKYVFDQPNVNDVTFFMKADVATIQLLRSNRSFRPPKPPSPSAP